MTKEPVQTLSRPENKGVVGGSGSNIKPWELDPELARLKIAEVMVDKLGKPSILKKPYIVRYGIFTAINHVPPTYASLNGEMIMIDPGNPTGIDCSLRLKIYEKVAAQSINEDGKYFYNFWAFMNQPRVIVQAGNMLQMQPQEEKQSMAGRIVNWFRGGKKNDQPQQ